MARKTSSQLSASFVDGATIYGSDFTNIFDSTYNLQDTGTQVSSGSLKLLGNITATEYIISSSVTTKNILNVSGSTHFGDSMDDIHTRTGSLLLTGSQTITEGSLTINTDGATVGSQFLMHGPGGQIMEISSSTGNSTLFLKASGSKNAIIDFEENEENRWQVGLDGSNNSFKISPAAFGAPIVEIDHAVGGDGKRAISMSAHLIPSTGSGYYNIGASDQRWGTVYLMGNTIDMLISGTNEQVIVGAQLDEDGTGSFDVNTGNLAVTGSGTQIFNIESSDGRPRIKMRTYGTNINTDIGFFKDLKQQFSIGHRSRSNPLFFISSGSAVTDQVFIIDGDTGNIGMGHGFNGSDPTRPSHTIELSGSSVNIDATNVYVTGSLYGDGSKLSGVSAFPFVGDAVITGSLLISGSQALQVDATNVVLGKNAGGGSVGTGTDDNNVIIGTDAAGAGNLNSGDSNVILGHSAGSGITTGDDNVIIGSDAASNGAYSGLASVYIGNEAGRSAAGANYNVAVGDGALYSLTTGDNNVALGRYASYGVSSNLDQVHIGYNAGRAATVDKSIAIGSEASVQAGGAGNTSMGYKALRGGTGWTPITTIKENTAIGYEAGKITTGEKNTFIGYQAAVAATSANNNVIIGNGTAATLTTGDSNIIIGPKVNIAAAGDSHQLRIGSGSLNVISGSLVTGDVKIHNDLEVGGALSKGSGTFQIAHPILENTQLYHSFIEGPKCDLIYRGEVRLIDGYGYVNINEESRMTNGTFEALTQNPQVFLQNTEGWDQVKGHVAGGSLHIECNNPQNTDLISWMVVAERADKFIKEWNLTDENGRFNPEQG